MVHLGGGIVFKMRLDDLVESCLHEMGTHRKYV